MSGQRDSGSVDARLPVPGETRAVLIGVNHYDELLELAPVKNNIDGLVRALTSDRLWGLPEANITVVEKPSKPADVHQAVIEAAEKALDTLLVYYGGHGLIHNGQLHLAIGDSKAKIPESTAVPYRWINESVRASKATTKIVILDCCYAERALRASAMNDDLSPLGAVIQPDSTGMYVFVAASATEIALVGDGEHTVFTGELLRLLDKGIPGGAATMSLRDVYGVMADSFRKRQFPVPRLYGDRGDDQVYFGANPLWTPDEERVEPAEPEGALTAVSLERSLREEQQEAIRARPGYRPKTKDGRDAPRLKIAIVKADEIEGTFEVEVTGVDGRVVTTTVTRDQIAAATTSSVELGRPLLALLASALLKELLPQADTTPWSPHNIGNGYPPEDAVLREPGRRSGARKILPTEAEDYVADQLNEGQHTLLLGAGASGKTTIARNQALSRGDNKGDGLIWLDLTDPDDGAESVLLTLLGLPEHERYLLVVDNLQAQAPEQRGHPVLSLVPRLTDRLGLPVTLLVTAWPNVASQLDIRGYGLQPVYTHSSRVINTLLKDLPPEDRQEILDLAGEDIEVALVALDYYRQHGATVPDRDQVAEQLARNTGADRLTNPRQQEVLYWFACLGALEIDIPKRHVDSWRDPDHRAAFEALLDAKLLEPNDESWSIGNSTRAWLLMRYALATWDDAAGFESRGRIVYDHLRRMGPRHIRHTLAQLRLKYGDRQRGDLGNLWAQCIDLAHQLEGHSQIDPSWGRNPMIAAFVATALGAMDSELTASMFEEVARYLDVLDPPTGADTTGQLATLGDATGTSLAARDQQGALAFGMDGRGDFGRRLLVGVLITAEAAVTGRREATVGVRRDLDRIHRFEKLAVQGRKPSGALGPVDAPWITAMIISGLRRLLRDGTSKMTDDAAYWLAKPRTEGGAFRDGWSVGEHFTQALTGNREHLDAFATAFCVRALNDNRQPAYRDALVTGTEKLRAALPGLAAPGSEVFHAAVVAALLHCGENWKDLAPKLQKLLNWAIMESQEEPVPGAAAADGVPWVASLLLTVVPNIVMAELEQLVEQVLKVDHDQHPDPNLHLRSDQGASPSDAGKRNDLQPLNESALSRPAGAEDTAAVTDPAVLNQVRDAASSLLREIGDQIAKRRSLLRDTDDREAVQAVQQVLAEWQALKSAVDTALSALNPENLAETIAKINEIGHRVFVNSWQDIAP